ncbi:hypothetical protein N1F91_19215 [Aquibium sp. ELW1220]|nr:hypothetical protein [Aquibium sp. ELW1220]
MPGPVVGDGHRTTRSADRSFGAQCDQSAGRAAGPAAATDRLRQDAVRPGFVGFDDPLIVHGDGAAGSGAGAAAAECHEPAAAAAAAAESTDRLGEDTDGVAPMGVDVAEIVDGHGGARRGDPAAACFRPDATRVAAGAGLAAGALRKDAVRRTAVGRNHRIAGDADHAAAGRCTAGAAFGIDAAGIAADAAIAADALAENAVREISRRDDLAGTVDRHGTARSARTAVAAVAGKAVAVAAAAAVAAEADADDALATDRRDDVEGPADIVDGQVADAAAGDTRVAVADDPDVTVVAISAIGSRRGDQRNARNPGSRHDVGGQTVDVQRGDSGSRELCAARGRVDAVHCRAGRNAGGPGNFGRTRQEEQSA